MDSPSPPRIGKSYKHRPRTLTARSLAESIAGKSCSICLSALEYRRAAVVIPCTHSYCVGCIRKWSNFKRKCPLCNADFDSWYCNFSPSSQAFQKEKLPAPTDQKEVVLQEIYSRRRRRLLERQRLIKRSREEFNALSLRTRPFPRLRSFGQQGDEHHDVISERVLWWRASIYKQQLQAVPFSSKNCLVSLLMGNDDAKRVLLQRVETWIRRELHAILEDPDPSVIVHLVTSLFISTYQQEQHCPLGQLGVHNDFLAPLRPFLHERAEMFWHELRCFAESSFCMDTYDCVVKYERLVE